MQYMMQDKLRIVTGVRKVDMFKCLHDAVIDDALLQLLDGDEWKDRHSPASSCMCALVIHIVVTS